MQAEDRRREARLRSHGRVSLILEGAAPVSATIRDISVEGLCLEASEALPIGVRVQLDGDGFTAEGIVRYCGRQQDAYRIGIEMEPLDQ